MWNCVDVAERVVEQISSLFPASLSFVADYEQQVNLLKKIDTNLLIINTHFAVIDNNKILNITKNDKLTIVKDQTYDGVIYEESKTFDSLKLGR
jgi:hypothetical protein